MNTLTKLGMAAVLAAGLASNAHALLINAPVPQLPTTPYTSPLIYVGFQTGVPQIFAEIATLSGNTINLSSANELYKQNVGEGTDSGSFASNYKTTFNNTPSDPSDALIEHVGGAKISANPLYLLVKDGNQRPAWYLYDITGWDGNEIELKGFWPNQGAISHVSLYGTGGGGGNSVPDGGATVVLLGVALAGLGFARRKMN